MTDKIIIDGVDVSGCERHCSDNRNNPNRCYSDMTRTYSNCNPKEKQCNFYITSIEKQLKLKEQECERLSFDNFDLKDQLTDLKFKYKTINDVAKSFEQKLQTEREECEELKEKMGTRCESCKALHIIADDYNDCITEIKQLKAENEILEKVNKKNQEKIKKLNETLQEEFIAKQYGDEALFFTLMDIKEIAETAVKGGYATKSFDYTQGMETIGSYVLQKIKEVIKDEE